MDTGAQCRGTGRADGRATDRGYLHLILENALSAVDALETGRHVEVSAIDPRLMPSFRPAVQGYLIDAMALDPIALVSRYKGPVLILQGEKDVQVRVQDAKLLQAASGTSELALFPELDHNLRLVGLAQGESAAMDGFAARFADFVTSHVPR